MSSTAGAADISSLRQELAELEALIAAQRAALRRDPESFAYAAVLRSLEFRRSDLEAALNARVFGAGQVEPTETNLMKSDISERVATKLGGSKAQGEEALNAVLDCIKAALAAGDRVVLTGFGSFEVRHIRARRVRPIRGAGPGNLIAVPARKQVAFTPGEQLSNAAGG